VIHSKAMPSKPKLWMLAHEDERYKIYRYKSQEGLGIWAEIQFDKVTETHPRIRCNWDDGRWCRLSDSVKHHAVAKPKAFEHLLKRTVETARVT
jgi:hypothetical protein